MLELLRSLVLHQAKFHQTLIAGWGTDPSVPRTTPEQVGLVLEAMVHDAVWLSKFPLLVTPTYDVPGLQALNLAWGAGQGTDPLTPEFAQTVVQVRVLRAKVDSELLRFILTLKPEVLETRVEIFFGGRAMNKVLWQYLLVWLERNAVLRGRLGTGNGMLETVFD